MHICSRLNIKLLDVGIENLNISSLSLYAATSGVIWPVKSCHMRRAALCLNQLRADEIALLQFEYVYIIQIHLTHSVGGGRSVGPNQSSSSAFLFGLDCAAL